MCQAAPSLYNTARSRRETDLARKESLMKRLLLMVGLLGLLAVASACGGGGERKSPYRVVVT